MWLEPVGGSLYIGHEEKHYGKNANDGDVDMLYLVRCMWHIALFGTQKVCLRDALAEQLEDNARRKKRGGGVIKIRPYFISFFVTPPMGIWYEVNSRYVYLNFHHKLSFSITLFHPLGISQVIFVSEHKSKKTMPSKLGTENTVKQ